ATSWFFFFQAEDGIRDRNVTGVQTCALPIYLSNLPNFVNRAESGSRLPCSSFSLLILLNLYILNIFSSNPGLFCLKRIGLPSFFLTRIAVTRITGLNTIIANKDNIKSIFLLNFLSYNPLLLLYSLFFILNHYLLNLMHDTN